MFITDADLGTFRHDNQVLIKIDVSDFDPLQADLEYSITKGSLPTGLSIDINSGEIHGTLARQSAVEVDHTFTVRANRVVATGLNTFSERQYTMKVVGEIDIGINFFGNEFRKSRFSFSINTQQTNSIIWIDLYINIF